jgi:transcriptional regulator with XRE-family HTH domain
MDEANLDSRIAGRLRRQRCTHGLSLEALSERSGVSRAMISKIERREASPTAALLGRLCAGLGITLAALFADEEHPSEPLSRRADQPTWRDPETGYVRRDVSPSGLGPFEIVEVSFPPGAHVVFDKAWEGRPPDQQVWVLDGVLEMTLGEVQHRLETGDCLHLRLDCPIAYHNPTERPVRYAVVLAREPRRA